MIGSASRRPAIARQTAVRSSGRPRPAVATTGTTSTPSRSERSLSSTAMPARRRLVHHAERDHGGHAGLDDLERQVEIAGQRRRVGHDHDRLGCAVLTAENRIDGHLLLRRACGERVGAWQIHQLGLAAVRERQRGSPQADGHPRVVADLSTRPGQRVEERRLAGVRVASDEHDRLAWRNGRPLGGQGCDRSRGRR